MKKIITILLVTLFSCTDDNNSFAPEQGTDFTKDISDESNFLLSTPTELKLIDKEFENNTINYSLGDTLKLALKFNSVYQETETDFYDIYKSTGAENFMYSIHFFDYNLQKIIDLKLLEKYPEIISNKLTDIEIQTSPKYKNLFLRNEELKVTYNEETREYESSIGIVLTKATIVETKNIQIASHLVNATNPKNITINIPVVSILDDHSKEIIINN
ncbi:hypothetical protein [Wenyingzhuangia sp. IMCC45574]